MIITSGLRYIKRITALMRVGENTKKERQLIKNDGRWAIYLTIIWASVIRTPRLRYPYCDAELMTLGRTR